MQFQVFVQCDSDLMLARRIKRDVKERARSVEGILDQSVYLCHYGDLLLTLFQFRYLRYVKPSYDNFVRPSSSHADIVRPRMTRPPCTSSLCLQIVPGSNNEVAIELICTHIRQQLQERSNCMRQRMAIPHRYLRSKSGTSSPESRLEDLNLAVLPKTPQLEVWLHMHA